MFSTEGECFVAGPYKPMLKLLGLGLASISLGGCAAAISAMKNDPLQKWTIRNPTMFAMTGDRRTAVVLPSSTGNRFCAESLPDAVAAFTAASKVSASLEGKASGTIDEATYAGLLQTFQRTEIAEIYRQMGWNLCLAWAQGATNDPNYMPLLTAYLNSGIDVIKMRAAQTQATPVVAGGHLILVGPAGTGSQGNDSSGGTQPPPAGASGGTEPPPTGNASDTQH